MFNSELHILKPVRNTVQCSTKSSVLDLLMWRFSLSVWTKVASFMDDFQICNPTRIFNTYSLPLKGVSFSNIIGNNHILFLVVINCLLFFNSFVCFEFAEKRAWSTTLVGCYGIYSISIQFQFNLNSRIYLKHPCLWKHVEVMFSSINNKCQFKTI